METITELNFDIAKEDIEIVTAIAKRASKMAKDNGDDYPLMDAQMDITATHLNGCPLKLKELRDADDYNFAYDVFGINRHIDRATGELQDCFLPRYSA